MSKDSFIIPVTLALTLLAMIMFGGIVAAATFFITFIVMMCLFGKREA